MPKNKKHSVKESKNTEPPAARPTSSAVIRQSNDNDDVLIVEKCSGEIVYIKQEGSSISVKVTGPNAGQGPPQYHYNAPPPGPPQNYMSPYQPPPQYSPVMSPPLTSQHNYQKSERNGSREKFRSNVFYPKHQQVPHYQQAPPLHIKNNLNNVHHTSPPLSPKKDNLKPGEETVNGELAEGPPIITLQELLSQIKPPEVTSTEPFKACIQWSPPDLSFLGEKELSGLLYEVFLNNHLYDTMSSTSLEFINLRPGTEYKFHLVCTCNGVRGYKTPTQIFCTKATIPDPPMPARLIDRKKQSLAFRWTAPKENGSRINNYNVEIMGGQWSCWTPIQKSRNRDFTINKLKPQTTYRIRLAAFNEIGMSEFGKETVATTVGLAPTQPLSPTLNSSSVSVLALSWTQRTPDEVFSLEMDDALNDYGFKPVFHGSETNYTCNSLRRNTDYKFRLSCSNINGKSPFSEIVCYRTIPDRPNAPPAPCLKGKPWADKLNLCWQVPSDHGGTQITAYSVEIHRSNGFESAYNGPSLECDIRNLRPGTEYQVRVCAQSNGGRSDWSSVGTVSTKPVEPAQCKPPRLLGKPKANTLQLKWGAPQSDGGATVTEYHIEMITPNSDRKQVYCGRDTECTVASLLPGRPYMFLLRAVNKEGPGSWSEPLEVVSGAGAPDAPRAPHLACKTPHSVLVSWEEPINNGARVESYSVQVAEVSSPSTESSESSSTSGEHECEFTFSKVYSGAALSAEVKNLTPANTFAFRVCAINVAGAGSFSMLSTATTPAASPAVVAYVSSNVEATEVTLHWTEPACHGDPITHYNIEIAEKTISTETSVLEYTIGELQPETNYKIRIQAVNSVGPSSFSSNHRVTTNCLPPEAPRIELVKASFNSLRLKWGDGRNNDLLKYSLMMELLNPHNNTMEFYQVYRGTNQTFKVGKLEENITYSLCISAANDAGVGPLSDPVSFSTTKAPPLPLKAPRVKEGPDGTYCIEWCGVRCPGEDTILYRLQMLQAGKDQDYSLIYFGGETSYIKCGLSPQTGYYVRVCGVRMCGDKEVVAGAYSSPTLFNTPKVESTKSSHVIVKADKVSEWGEMTDQHKAMAILILFSLLAFVAAYVLSPDSVR